MVKALGAESSLRSGVRDTSGRNVLTCRERDSRLSADESVGAEMPDIVGGDGMGGGLVGVCARLLRDAHDCLHGHRGYPPRIYAFAHLPRRAYFFHQLRQQRMQRRMGNLDL